MINNPQKTAVGKVGDLVKWTTPIGTHVGTIVAFETWIDKHGPYEMVRVFGEKTLFSLASDQYEIINECA